MYNISDLISKISAEDAAPVINATGAGKYSFGIVNSEGNGKRITLSKALSSDLGLTDHLELLPYPKDGILIIGANLNSEFASSCTLRGKEKKIGYAAPIVHLLTQLYAIDFSSHVSKSFSDVTLDSHNGEKVAVITMCAASAVSEDDIA